MPTTTFFNLPEEKREKLIRAIKNEFSRVPFDKVSINKIVREAEIPRGSFYQYFTDKTDMLEFILSDYKDRILRHIKDCLRANSGDIFGMFYDMLEFTIDFTMKEKDNHFCKNLFSDIKVNKDTYLKVPRNAAETAAIKELQPYIDFNLFDLRDPDDFDHMLGILSSVCRDATVEVFLNIAECEEIKQKYKNRLDLLKRGFLKNKE